MTTRRFIRSLGVIFCLSQVVAGGLTAEEFGNKRVYTMRLVRIPDPKPLLADHPKFVEPIRETERFEAPALVADDEVDLSVRAWRTQFNARGIIEMPNRLNASQTAIIVVQAVLIILLNIILFNAEIPGNLLWSLVVLLVGTLAFTAMGFALAGLSRNTDVAGAAARALSLPMQFLCGTLIPIDEMPPLLQTIARALPLSYLVDALRGAVLSNDVAGHMGEWAILLGCMVISFLVAVKTFRWE